MDKIEFVKKITGLSMVFKEDLSKEVINIYYEILKDYSDDQINLALNICLKTCKFFPKPAEIIELIEGNQADKSLLAWEQVKESIFKIGSYQSVIFVDKVIHKVINVLGGWQKICMTLEDDMKWLQKDFERLYRAYQNQPLGDYPERLIGIIEETNYLNRKDEFITKDGQIKHIGDFIPEPVLIGFEKKELEDKRG